MYMYIQYMYMYISQCSLHTHTERGEEITGNKHRGSLWLCTYMYIHVYTTCIYMYIHVYTCIYMYIYVPLVRNQCSLHTHTERGEEITGNKHRGHRGSLWLALPMMNYIYMFLNER